VECSALFQAGRDPRKVVRDAGIDRPFQEICCSTRRNGGVVLDSVDDDPDSLGRMPQSLEQLELSPRVVQRRHIGRCNDQDCGRPVENIRAAVFEILRGVPDDPVELAPEQSGHGVHAL